ncbi:hypothetical protein [Umezawaea sp.]|uniref:hypothetical protein n=1 Tax=Umezawaea sp. TaxID=1955258 RepID=UPI002ED3696C
MDVTAGGSWHFGFSMTPAIPEMLLDGHQEEFFRSAFDARSTPSTFGDEDIAYHAKAYEGRDRLRGGFEHYRTLLDDGRENRAALATRRPTAPVPSIGDRDSVADGTTEALRPHADDLTGLVAPTGHFAAEEAPEWFVRTLLDYLAATPRTAADRVCAP